MSTLFLNFLTLGDSHRIVIIGGDCGEDEIEDATILDDVEGEDVYGFWSPCF